MDLYVSVMCESSSLSAINELNYVFAEIFITRHTEHGRVSAYSLMCVICAHHTECGRAFSLLNVLSFISICPGKISRRRCNRSAWIFARQYDPDVFCPLLVAIAWWTSKRELNRHDGNILKCMVPDASSPGTSSIKTNIFFCIFEYFFSIVKFAALSLFNGSV